MSEQIYELNEQEVTPLVDADVEEVIKAMCDILDSKKARNIKVYSVVGKSDITDYTILATGTSSTHVKALADELEYQTARRGVPPIHFEGRGNGSWIVVDYANIIVHVFSNEAREFYNLDRLYNDATEVQS